jgi:hypothetical protein
MVPCALATPVPAINTAAAADNNNRFFIYISSHMHCPRDNERRCVMFLREALLFWAIRAQQKTNPDCDTVGVDMFHRRNIN